MARKLPDIPKCQSCGRPVIGLNGAYCKVCQIKRAHEDYEKVVRAEQNMSTGEGWKQGYSPWKGIMVIAGILAVLVLLIALTVMVASR